MLTPKVFGKLVHVQPLSLSDYPGKLAAILFFAGCNLRCPFCYNSELVLPDLMDSLSALSLPTVLEGLRDRRGFLDGVVLTGGEPTLAPELPELLRALKDLGFLVKLDTNGTNPHVLRGLLQAGLIDYVALDIKAPFSRYREYTGLPSSQAVVRAVRESVELVRELSPDYEFRTTVAPGLQPEDLLAIVQEIGEAKRYVLQPFVVPRGKRLVDESFRQRPSLSAEELRSLLPELSRFVPTELRA